MFSRLYVDRSTLLPDSSRLRVRLAQFFADHLKSSFGKSITKAIPLELGVEVPYEIGEGQSVPEFFKKASIADVLSAITLIYTHTSEVTFESGTVTSKPSNASLFWKNFVGRAFREENVAYTLDDACGVHPLVDVEFQRNLVATVAGLGQPRYSAVRHAFESAQKNFEKHPQDAKSAIRDLFEGVETLFKLMNGSGKGLDASAVRTYILPRVQRIYAGDRVASMVAARLANSFADWVDAAHPYRHGHEAQEPVTLPADLAVLLFSQGAAFIRWLIDVDAANASPPNRAPP